MKFTREDYNRRIEFNNESLLNMVQELREHARQMLLWKYSKTPDK